MKHSLFIPVALSILLSACLSRFTAPEVPPQPPVTDIETERDEFTRNVAYRGTVEFQPPSVAMEGTHRLTLGAGRSILLQSTTVDLDAFTGLDVEVTGDVRPAVSAGLLLMEVHAVRSLEESSSSESSDSSDSKDSSESSSESSESSDSSMSPVTPSSTSSEAVPPSSPPSTPSSATGAFEARVRVMAAANIEGGQWTQRYCTSHIGFCVAVHRNWWFKSFGATTSALWRVEINSEEINVLGEGPIVIALQPGPAGGNDRTVVAGDAGVTGYYSWTGNRHFEISAPHALRGAVAYMLAHMEPYSP